LTHAYDALNRLIEVSDPLSRETTYTYDAAGNLDTRTDARGLVTDYAYDSLNRLTNIDYSGSTTPDVSFTYDDVGNRLTMADGTGTTSYVYDALNRLTEVTFPGSRTVDYEYDNAGNRSRIEYPGGTRDVDYTYDAAGRMLTVTDWLSNVTEYTYNNAGYLTLTELPNGVTVEYGYDGADRLTSVVNEGPGGVLSSFTYTLDDVGNRTQVVTPEGTESYTYDDLYRLTGVTYPDSTSESFSYDAVGNRTATAVLAYTYDDADQMLTAGSTTFDYDNNGNQIERGADTLSYDHENRLVGGTFGSTSVSMAYDGDGLRQSLTEGSQTDDFVWDVASPLPVTLEDDSAAYVYGLDLISSIDGSSAEMYYSYDGLGSAVNLTDHQGVSIADHAYLVFGAPRGSAGSETWGFTGEQRDLTGFNYLRARFYDPLTGRFVSQDPFAGLLGQPSSQSNYPYAGNDPVNYVDPNGLHHCKGQVFCEAPCHDGYGPSEAWPGECASSGEGSPQFYIDLSVTLGIWFVGTFGAQIDQGGSVHFYGGVGLGTPGASASIAPGQSISEGVYCGTQGGAALVYQRGIGGGGFGQADKEEPTDPTAFWEVGVGWPPGVSGTCGIILPGVW
jgi:RHS repeat-associated protein